MTIEIRDLTESNEFLNILFDNINSAIFILDSDVRVRSINNSFKTLFYKDQDEALGMLCGNALGCLFPIEEHRDCGDASNCNSCELRRSIINSLNEHESVYKSILERKFYINDECINKYLQITTKHILFMSQDMVMVIVDDISERERQRVRLVELNEMKNRFLSVAAHDLRNPISNIIGFSEFLLVDLRDSLDEEVYEPLKLINRSADFMLKLVNNLLDISIIESGNIKLDYKGCEYVEFVREVVKLNQMIANKKGIKLEFTYNVEELYIEIDKQKIKQVLDNLISNGIKYSYPDSKITIFIEMDEGVVRTNVIDNGDGIPDEAQADLFKEFHTSVTKATSGEQSTGLGLAIAKKIVTEHGGSIFVKSSVGVGSNFYFELPLSN